MANTFGRIFRLTTFGESHGTAIGGVIDGCPSGISIDVEQVQSELNRRKPGQSNLVTQRKESDKVEFLSGIFEGKTTGTPIGFLIRNENQKPHDYDHIKDKFRPSHADFTYFKKYEHYDYRGGGRSSARETVARVVGGAIAKQVLKHFIPEIEIQAFVSAVGTVVYKWQAIDTINFDAIEQNVVRCPDRQVAKQMEQLIASVKKQGDSVGGKIDCIVTGVPIGLGEPVFDKLHARLAYAIMGINAVKSFEYGGGKIMSEQKGSEVNDDFYIDEKTQTIKTKTNFSGGVQGGISNGMPIYFSVGFKPVATIMRKIVTVNKANETTELPPKGRHDACVVPRAVPIVEAMTAMVLLDFYLQQKAYTFNS